MNKQVHYLKSYTRHFAIIVGACAMFHTGAVNLAGNANMAPRPQIKPRSEIVTPHTRKHEPIIKAKTYTSSQKRSAQHHAQAKAVKSRIKSLINQDRLNEAVKYLNNNQRYFDNVEFDQQKANIAAAYLYNKQTLKALELSGSAFERSGMFIPKAGWIAGLSSWHRGQYIKAAHYFDSASQSDYAGESIRAGAAFWAARSYQKIGNVYNMRQSLGRALSAPETFYGLIAARATDRDFLFETPPSTHKLSTNIEYIIDPALVYAIVQKESLFNPRAKSYSGAKGLMQIMPKTAQFIAKQEKVSLGADQNRLYEPHVNLRIGQAYLAYLMKDKNVQGDVIHLLTAYNAGPGNLSRWKKRWANVEDPLFFMEVVPTRETRSYIERVMKNYWVYRLRHREETPLLDKFASSTEQKHSDSSAHILANF